MVRTYGGSSSFHEWGKFMLEGHAVERLRSQLPMVERSLFPFVTIGIGGPDTAGTVDLRPTGHRSVLIPPNRDLPVLVLHSSA
jgi:hypothetical protein